MLLPDPEQDHAFNLRRRERVLEAFSPREFEYVYHVCHPDEHTNKAIAECMGIGVDRVGEYAKSLKKKFDVCSKAGVVRFACAWRLVPLYHWLADHGHLSRAWHSVGTGLPSVPPPQEDGVAGAE